MLLSSFTTQRCFYSCRYMAAHETVYVLQKVRRDSMMYYTIPFKNKETGIVQNTLLAFQSSHAAHTLSDTLDAGDRAWLCPADIVSVTQQRQRIKKQIPPLVRKLDLADLLVQAHVLRMPLVVILNSYCRTDDQDLGLEIFYKA